MSKTPEEFMEEISRATAPAEMIAKDALIFLENLVSLIEGSIDGLRDDICEENS